MAFDKSELTKMREFLIQLCKRRGQAKKPVVEMIEMCQKTLFEKLPTKTEKYKMLETLREEKVEFILYQMKLVLMRRDFVRC